MAARSTSITWSNELDSSLELLEADLDHGEWTTNPPQTIAAGEEVFWGSESDAISIGTGTEGHVRYGVGQWLPTHGGERITALARSVSNLDLFVVGHDGVVYTAWWAAGGDWSSAGGSWWPIGGTFPAGAPIAAVARTPENIDLFVVGDDGIVYTSWWVAGQDWSGLHNWRPIGGTFPAGAPIAAVSRTPGNIDLFVVGNDGIVYTSWWYAGQDWSGLNNWRPIGGTFPAGAPVAAVSRTPGNIDLFVVGNDGLVYTSWWYAGQDWSGLQNWRPIGGGQFAAGAAIAAVTRDQTRLDVFAMGALDGLVYTSGWVAGQDWSGLQSWRAIGGTFPTDARVTAISRTPDNMDLFVVGNDGLVYTSWWYAGQDWSGLQGWRAVGGIFPAGAPVEALLGRRHD